MEQHGGTTSLRNAAPQWSLAGDKKLLQLLQDIHQKVVTKCKETNSLLDQMITSLDDASIDIQTVNNKFMSLSNSQFVESRVYGDDADVATTPPPAKSTIRPDTPSELALIKSSLQILENNHEVVEILPDTDSDTDDEGVASVVLKPRNVYADRPLPYIIGTRNWRNKWHAGTVPSDSDSSSVQSRSRQSQYSESESEHEPSQQWTKNDDTLSSSSSAAPAPSAPPAPPAPPGAPPPRPSPADLASELARRLGNVPQMPEPGPVYEPPKMDTTKIYKPEAPVTATIFSDEPPPLPETSESESEQEDNDIFAELHKENKPAPFASRTAQNVDLFGDNDVFGKENKGNIEKTLIKPAVNRKPTVNTEVEKSESFAPNPVQNTNQVVAENAVKKPVGGISLFGSNKESESIGAAILKRNQRKASSDEDSGSDSKSNEEPKQVKQVENKPVKKVENEIFENLFSKPKSANKKVSVKAKEPVKVATEPVKKIDLFADDIFDDIDDIFSSNFKSNVPKNDSKQQKPVFENEDQLFSEVAVSKPVKDESKDSIESKTKGLFDSDDELFSEKIETVNTNSAPSIINKPSSVNLPPKPSNSQSKETKSIFDDSSDDDLFAKVDIKTPPTVSTKKSTKSDQLPKVDNLKPSVSKSKNENNNKQVVTSTNTMNSNNNQILNTPNISNTLKTESFQSPALFDDEDDDLFTNPPNTVSPKANTNDDNRNIYNIEPDQKETLITGEKSESENNEQFIEEKETSPSYNTENLSVASAKQSYSNQEETIDDTQEICKDLPKNTPKDDLTENIAVTEPDLQQQSADTDENRNSPKQDLEEKLKTDLEKSLEESLLKHTDLEKQDVITDIFADEPPVFEKTNEPKKSKNINALFDDDSDDESLFFKKEEIVVDEKPKVFESITKPSRFGIFQDEPPDLDIDFIQKDEKVIKNLNENTDKVNTAQPLIQPQQTKEEDCETKVEAKKIGKLKPMNLNINVSSLLPGASPKKSPKSTKENINDQPSNIDIPKDTKSNTIVKTADTSNDVVPDYSETDGQIVSSETKETIPKSVSFDKNPESSVLDNKISKERAKIQVKRRPSSRRARHEAVRISIRNNQDESNDSTDNSSSIDDHNTKKQADTEATTPKSNVDTISDASLSSTVTNPSKKETSDIKNTKEIKETTPQSEVPLSKDSHLNLVDDTVDSKNLQKDVKSKIVYVLNDEDIFTNTKDSYVTSDTTQAEPVEKKEPVKKSKTLTILDDDDALFKTSISQQKTTIEKSNPVKSPQEKPQTKSKKPLFDDSSDDEALFKPKTLKTKKPVTIFGSDSDEDIFSGKTKETKPLAVREKRKEMVVKKSLFSDDDDDDDLFGANKNKAAKPSQPTQSTSNITKPTSYAVDDPLSFKDDTSI